MTEKKKHSVNEVADELKKRRAEEAAKDESDAPTESEVAVEETPENAEQAKPAEESADIKFTRLAADFQNYKQRAEKERFERYTEGKKDFAADLLPVLDNFERALATEAGEKTQFFEGMELVYQQLTGVLEKNGVKEIKALGETFDPNFHHAVVMEATKDYESSKVSEALQKGYALGEKVIRPAMVKVAE